MIRLPTFNLGKRGPITMGPSNKVYPPQGLSFTPGINVVLRNGVYSTDYDVTSNEITGKTYYVSTTGDNGNTGLSLEQAFGTLRFATQRADVDVILMGDGVYKIPNLGGATAQARAISLKAINSGAVYIVQEEDLSWALSGAYSATYEATGSYNMGTVFDASNPTADGDWMAYTLQANTDAVEANAGSYYVSGKTVYVHTFDGRAPDDDVRAYTPGFDLITNSTGRLSWYCEGINFEGGNTAMRFINSAGSPTPSFYAKDCSFKYALNNNLEILTGGTVAIDGCRAAYSAAADGFNYDDSNSVAPTVIEINCTAGYNGSAADSIDNGSTGHGGSKIIRLNGTYDYNWGSNVADIEAGTESWNIGCAAENSQATSEPNYNTGFTCHTSATVRLEGCTTTGNTNALNVENGGTLYVRGCSLTGSTVTAGTGTVVTLSAVRNIGST